MSFFYFSYNISQEYFHHNLLSDLYTSEREAIRALSDLHNGDEVAFFLGDDYKVSPTMFDTIEGAVENILNIYKENFKDIQVEIKLVKYITTGERYSFQTKR